jgi:uncharacterized protein with ATP-grasp and redox domains
VSRSYYTRLLDDVFIQAQTLVSKRQNAELDLSWLYLAKQEYFPDYFRVHTFGRNKIEAVLNTLSYKLMPVLWKRYIWKRMCRKMCAHIRDNHVHYFDLPREDKKLFVNVCYRHLMSNWAFWAEATFVDIFIFIASSMKKFSEDVLGVSDRFLDVKRDQNQKMLSLVNEIKEDVFQHPQATSILAYLAIKGNWMDVFENDPDAFFIAFSEEVNELIDSDEIILAHKHNNPFFHIESFTIAVEGVPKRILYECDNSGEVVLDLMFIEYLLQKGHTVTVVTRENPFLNDVLDSEIKTLISQHMPKLEKAIEEKTLTLLSHTLPFAGKVFTEVSEAYKAAYKDANFMIAKGQGHFQMMPMKDTIKSKTYIPYRLPIFYLFGIRADIIHWCCNALFENTKPEKGTVVLYAYDYQNSATHPA